MARLSIAWRTRTTVAPAAVTTGESNDAAEARTMRADKPMMVYIPSDDPADYATRKLEDVVFANEKMAIGSKFFDAIKVSEGNALTDRILKETGRDTPRIVFLTRDYKEHKSFEGRRISAGRLVRAMSGLVRKEYKNSFDKMVRSYTKLLNDLDRLESKRAKLASDEARLREDPNPSRQRRLERDQAEFQKEMDEWNEKEKEILAFRPRGAPKSEA